MIQRRITGAGKVRRRLPLLRKTADVHTAVAGDLDRCAGLPSGKQGFC